MFNYFLCRCLIIDHFLFHFYVTHFKFELSFVFLCYFFILVIIDFIIVISFVFIVWVMLVRRVRRWVCLVCVCHCNILIGCGGSRFWLIDKSVSEFLTFDHIIHITRFFTISWRSYSCCWNTEWWIGVNYHCSGDDVCDVRGRKRLVLRYLLTGVVVNCLSSRSTYVKKLLSTECNFGSSTFYDYIIVNGCFGIPFKDSLHVTYMRATPLSKKINLYDLSSVVPLSPSLLSSAHIRYLVLHTLLTYLSKNIANMFLSSILPPPFYTTTVYQCISSYLCYSQYQYTIDGPLQMILNLV